MRKGKMKKSIVTIAMAMMLSVTAVVGFGTNAKAANVRNETYSFNNGNSSGETSPREKQDTTKVYVYPQSGPTIKYAVYGATSQYGSWTPRSVYHRIPTGVQASITNNVKEKNENYAKLSMLRIQTINQDTTGVWSPDSTRNYTIYG